jgi:hypothetical protein
MTMKAKLGKNGKLEVIKKIGVPTLHPDPVHPPLLHLHPLHPGPSSSRPLKASHFLQINFRRGFG